jgi:pimeloyl-ACP methyl ester carboxylesterase
MTRRRWLWLLGTTSVVLFAVLAALDARLVEEGGWGIVDFELAGSREDAREMVAAWGEKGHDAALLSLWLDYVYMAAYGAFGVLAVAAVRDMARRHGWERMAALGRVLVPVPAASAACDALENAGLLLALGDHGGAAAPVLATAFAVAKFVLIEVAFLYVVVALVRRAWERRRALTAAVLALLGLLVAGTVAVGVPAQRETEAARPGGDGQVLRLPGGDLYVEDSGPRGDAAIVLIHGYTGSTRWWSRVTPALARDHRTVNVDLLGHGRSEKPREGYEMENQARLVLAALGRLGVRRAVVVGHSMGGWVALSMAEQDPRLVRGVATIGTPADRAEGPGPFGKRLGYLPVVGPATWKAVPDSYVRSELKSAFAEGVPVPDEFVADTRRLTWSAFARAAQESRNYRDERAPFERMTAVGLPFLAIVGTEDDRAKAETTEEWERVPRGRVVRMRGVGHTPPWERPGPTTTEIIRFADRVEGFGGQDPQGPPPGG